MNRKDEWQKSREDAWEDAWETWLLRAMVHNSGGTYGAVRVGAHGCCRLLMAASEATLKGVIFAYSPKLIENLQHMQTGKGYHRDMVLSIRKQ